MKKFLTIFSFVFFLVFLAYISACNTLDTNFAVTSTLDTIPIPHETISTSTYQEVVQSSPTSEEVRPTLTVTATMTTTTPQPISPILTPTPPPSPSPFAPEITKELTLNLLNQQGGIINSVAVVSQTAFVGAGPQLIIIDIANPTEPQTLGQSGVLPGLVRAVLVQDGLAYVGAGQTLFIFDVSNPHMPMLTAQMELPATITRLALTKQTLVAGQSIFPSIPVDGETTGIVTTIDISEAANLTLLNSVTIPQAVDSIAASDTIVYVGNNGSGSLYAIDISDPVHLSEPRMIPNIVIEHGSLPLGGDMALFGDTLLTGGNYFVALWRMADPLQPELLWQSELINGAVVEFAAEEGVVYLRTAGPPSEPVMLLSVPELQSQEAASVSTNVVVQGNQLIIGWGNLDLYTINDGESVTHQASYHVPGVFPGPTDMALVGRNGLIISQDRVRNDQNSGLSIVQLPDLSLLGNYINEKQCDLCDAALANVAVVDSLAYVIGGDGTLHIFDVSDTTQPVLVAAHTPLDFDSNWQRIYDLSIINERGYAVGYANDQTVLLEFALSDPQNVQVVSKTHWSGSAERIAATEEDVYVYSILFTDQTAHELRHFRHLDGELTLVDSVEIASPIYDIVPAGNVVLLGTADGLSIVSTEEATGQLAIMAQAQIEGGLWELALMDDVLLATTAEFWGDGRLLAIDLQDPTQPRLIGTVSLPSSKAQLAVTGEGIILVGNVAMGLMVFAASHK